MDESDLGRFDASVLSLADFFWLKRANFKIAKNIGRIILSRSSFAAPAVFVGGIDLFQVDWKFGIEAVTRALSGQKCGLVAYFEKVMRTNLPE